MIPQTGMDKYIGNSHRDQTALWRLCLQ